MVVVAKFGGSSLSNEEQFRKVKAIIESDKRRKIVVVSALGKRNPQDSKITDLLYILYAHIKHNVPYDSIWNTIANRYREVVQTLKIDWDIDGELRELEDQFQTGQVSEEYLVSRGEYLAAKIMSRYLGFKFVDAKDVISFRYNGTVDLEKTEERATALLGGNTKAVIPGFYGGFPDGEINLFNRGGSDVTGAILAQALNAEVYENWTDVSGIRMADPRIVSDPLPIEEITYTELRELSYMGASVINEETILPVQERNIPLHIKNTNAPEDLGTVIANFQDSPETEITGIAGRKDFLSITIYKNMMSNEVGFLHRTLGVFARRNISVEHIPTGIDNVGVIVAEEAVRKNIHEIIEELETILETEHIQVTRNIAMVAVVSRALRGNVELPGKIFTILGEKDIGIKMIAHSPKELTMVIGVDNMDYEACVKALYEGLVEE